MSTPKIHQIRIDFQVTEQIRRYVFVYIIEGQYCYLVDTGVFGCENHICDYLKSIGRDVSHIKGILLTHAHPDHIGAAACSRIILAVLYTPAKVNEPGLRI